MIAEPSDAHQPPPRVSVSTLRVLWTLDSLPAPVSARVGDPCRYAQRTLAPAHCALASVNARSAEQ